MTTTTTITTTVPSRDLQAPLLAAGDDPLTDVYKAGWELSDAELDMVAGGGLLDRLIVWVAKKLVIAGLDADVDAVREFPGGAAAEIGRINSGIKGLYGAK